MATFRTLKSRRQFLAVARTGRRSVRPGLILQVGDKHVEGSEPPAPGQGAGQRIAHKTGPRIGFTVSRKVGNAVARNRVKRRFRVLARDLLADAADPARDYVLVGRRTAVTRPFALLQKDMEQALQDLKEKKQAQ
ncbi:MAG: ribonuclease P protein component [Proteobacteria bacterium]|nr:ribonuclease P protein component [Pseudomonadota bacterium]